MRKVKKGKRLHAITKWDGNASARASDKDVKTVSSFSRIRENRNKFSHFRKRKIVRENSTCVCQV